MDNAVVALRQLFAVPSTDLMQQHPLCGICWSDYDGKDRPVKLPCGHVFGEECIIAWAKGTTPTGRHNGCPTCRAGLLPPSLYSRTSALSYWLSDTPEMWPACRDILGGPLWVAFSVGLKMVNLGAGLLLESQIGACIRVGSAFCGLGFLAYRSAKVYGWRWAIIVVTTVVMVDLFATWVTDLLPW